MVEYEKKLAKECKKIQKRSISMQELNLDNVPCCILERTDGSRTSAKKSGSVKWEMMWRRNSWNRKQISSGPDGMHETVLKKLAEELSEPLCILSKRSIENQTYLRDGQGVIFHQFIKKREIPAIHLQINRPGINCLQDYGMSSQRCYD